MRPGRQGPSLLEAAVFRYCSLTCVQELEEELYMDEADFLEHIDELEGAAIVDSIQQGKNSRLAHLGRSRYVVR